MLSNLTMLRAGAQNTTEALENPRLHEVRGSPRLAPGALTICTRREGRLRVGKHTTLILGCVLIIPKTTDQAIEVVCSRKQVL